MAKTLRTSGDYTVKAGAGSAGSNTIYLDAKTVRIPGDLAIDGTQTVINSTTLTIEDQFLEVNRNNSTAGSEDSGVIFNQGTSNNAILYYDAGLGEFQIGTTTHDASINTVTNITLGNIKVATNPTDNNHAASKYYVDNAIVGGGFTIFFTGDDSTVIEASPGNTVGILGGSNISTVASEEPDTVTVSLNNDLTNITSVTSDASNSNLTLTANGTGAIVVNNILTFNSNASTPSASSITKVYSKTVGGGGTGLFFINSNVASGTEDELISKKKATALAIALG